MTDTSCKRCGYSLNPKAGVCTKCGEPIVPAMTAYRPATVWLLIGAVVLIATSLCAALKDDHIGFEVEWTGGLVLYFLALALKGQ